VKKGRKLQFYIRM